MNLLTPPPEVAQIGLRAMKMIAARGPHGFAAPARNLLLAAQKHVLKVDVDLDSLGPISAAELVAGFPPGPLRAQFVQGMLMVSLVDGEPTQAQMNLVHEFAAGLGVDESEVTLIRRLADHQTLMFRLDFMRRSHIADIFKEQFRHHGGLTGLVRGILGLRGFVEDEALAQRYQALGKLPQGTLGHSFYTHYRTNGFALPGEKGGFPEAGVYHDFAHVLSGYGPTPEEETLVGAFTAGFKKGNPLFVVLFVLLTFGAGVNVTPVAQPHVEAIFATPGLADRFFRAHERGQAMNADLSDNWNFWPLMGLPLDEARRQLNLPPE
jgi:hypothetical protein